MTCELCNVIEAQYEVIMHNGDIHIVCAVCLPAIIESDIHSMEELED